MPYLSADVKARSEKELVAIERNWLRSRPSAFSVDEPQTGENARFRSYRNGLEKDTVKCCGNLAVLNSIQHMPGSATDPESSSG